MRMKFVLDGGVQTTYCLIFAYFPRHTHMARKILYRSKNISFATGTFNSQTDGRYLKKKLKTFGPRYRYMVLFKRKKEHSNPTIVMGVKRFENSHRFPQACTEAPVAHGRS